MPKVLSKKMKGRPAVDVTETQQEGVKVVRVALHPGADVCSEGGCIVIWGAGLEVRVGPLTPEQAEQLSDDLGYDAVAE